MLKVEQPGVARILEFRSKAGHDGELSIQGLRQQSLLATLSGLRAEVNGLTVKLSRESGSNSEAAVRAEQIAHAIQRLEWALQREDDLSAS